MVSPRPITEYVLTVHASTKWDLTNYQAKGEFGFESEMVFLKSSSPFPVPHVGHEIVVQVDGVNRLGTDQPTPQVLVVTRVKHRIKASEYGVTCEMDVYTELAPRPDTRPDEMKRGRSG